MISLKPENLARRWRIVWHFQIFLMATDLFLFIRDVLYAHIRQHKKILCCTNNCCVNKKKCFTWKLTLRNKIIWATKKYAVATKKIMWHPKEDSCCLSMFKGLRVYKKWFLFHINPCWIDWKCFVSHKKYFDLTARQTFIQCTELANRDVL